MATSASHIGDAVVLLFLFALAGIAIYMSAKVGDVLIRRRDRKNAPPVNIPVPETTSVADVLNELQTHAAIEALDRSVGCVVVIHDRETDERTYEGPFDHSFLVDEYADALRDGLNENLAPTEDGWDVSVELLLRPDDTLIDKVRPHAEDHTKQFHDRLERVVDRALRRASVGE